MQIVGSTYIWKLNVPYIGIDPAFPHRINSFDNVPLNYDDGPLVYISDIQTVFDTLTTTMTTYTNTINFT